MLLIILSVVLLALGITFLCLYNNSKWNSIWRHDWWEPLGLIFVAVGVFSTLLTGVLAIVLQTTKEVDYQNAVHEREALVYRLEHREENVVGNEMLYAEIVEFNNGLRVTKKWASDPWVGVFNNDLIAELDYIDFTEVDDDA